MMKTYKLLNAFMAFCVIGCSKSENVTDPSGTTDENFDANYTILLNSNGKLSGMLLNGDAETLTVNDSEYGFADFTVPQLISKDDKVMTMYHKKSNCSGTVTLHDLNEATSKSIDLFTDLGACNLTVKAIIKGGNTVYLAYEKKMGTNSTEFWLRAVDIAGSGTTFEDAELEYNPEGMAFSNNRLFILGLEEKISGEYRLSVLDGSTISKLFEEDLGFDARNIFKNPQGNIIIAYDTLHSTFNSVTMSVDYTQYPQGKAPNFVNSKFNYFDSEGKMYYATIAGTNSVYSQIPAVYDFDKNLTVLYAYENFLTEAQLNFEFEIENTTVVNYDEANSLLLVGYKKTGTGNKGGLLRIKTGPSPKFAGNLDLNGAPYAIYVD